MNPAMERLALIAAVLLPVTAIASVYGMNIIVGDHTDVPQLGVVLAIMGLVVGGMLASSKRLGWWWPPFRAWTDRTGLSVRPADGTFVLIEG